MNMLKKKRENKWQGRLLALVMTLILAVMLLPGKVSAAEQTWITFDASLAVTGPVETDDGQIYTATADVAVDAEGWGSISYSVGSGQNYCPAVLYGADSTETGGASAVDSKGRERTVTLSNLQQDTTYRLYWDKTTSNNNLNVDVYLVFHTGTGESSGGDTPTQNWITFDASLGLTDPEATDAGLIYTATTDVAVSPDGEGSISYSVSSGQNYCPAVLYGADSTETGGASAVDSKGRERTVTLSNLQYDTTYRLYWDKTTSNNNLIIDVYLIFHTQAEPSGDTPTQDWITFDGNTEASMLSADEETGIIYLAKKNVPFNDQGQVVITYTVDGAKQYAHAQILDIDGRPVEGASVDEPDATSRTATISGLTAGSSYQLFWDKELSNNKLSYNVYLKFTIGPLQNWMTFQDAVYKYSYVTGNDDDTDYYETTTPLEFNGDGAIVYRYSVNGAKTYAHVNVQNADGTPAEGITVDEPDENERTATITGLQGETPYRFFWDKTQSNGRLTRHVVMFFTTGAFDEDALRISGIESSYDYTGEPICPEPTVTYHEEELVKGTDYEVTYSEDTINAGTKNITVTGLGTYEHKTAEKEYTINKVSLSDAVVTLPAGVGTSADGTVQYAYTGSKVQPAPTVIVGGRKLTKGVDFRVDYYNAEDPDKTDLINADNAAKLTVEVSQIASGNYVGGAASKPVYTIVPKKVVPTVSAANSAYTYTGKAITPAVTVKDGTKTLKGGTDYTVGYGSGRKNVGTYKITVTLKGNYTGSASTSFKINPKATTLSKVKAGKKKFTAKWKKQSAITGYELQYSLKKKFSSGNKTVTVNGMKKVSKVIKKLKAKKTYYVRIRTYKKASGSKYYSPWSKAKKVRTK